MAFQTVWFETEIPTEIVDIIERDCREFNDSARPAETMDGVDLKTRDSKTSWMPDHHWVTNFVMSYVIRANKSNWQYDVDAVDGGNMQYTIYEEGQYYHWHIDAGVDALEQDAVRKLSVVLQLSNYDEYEGGEFQMLNEQGKLYMAPKKRGTLIIFDSRCRHRIRPIKSGVRKSLVGWITGPRWK